MQPDQPHAVTSRYFDEGRSWRTQRNPFKPIMLLGLLSLELEKLSECLVLFSSNMKQRQQSYMGTVSCHEVDIPVQDRVSKTTRIDKPVISSFPRKV